MTTEPMIMSTNPTRANGALNSSPELKISRVYPLALASAMEASIIKKMPAINSPKPRKLILLIPIRLFFYDLTVL
jgi:hypothetical protein